MTAGIVGNVAEMEAYDDQGRVSKIHGRLLELDSDERQTTA